MAFQRPFKNPFRRAFRQATRMQYGLRRPRRVSDLAFVNRCIARLLQWHVRMARQYPELFDFSRFDREQAEAEAQRQRQDEIQAILKRVYGTPEI